MKIENRNIFDILEVNSLNMSKIRMVHLLHNWEENKYSREKNKLKGKLIRKMLIPILWGKAIKISHFAWFAKERLRRIIVCTVIWGKCMEYSLSRFQIKITKNHKYTKNLEINLHKNNPQHPFQSKILIVMLKPSPLIMLFGSRMVQLYQ